MNQLSVLRSLLFATPYALMALSLLASCSTKTAPSNVTLSGRATAGPIANGVVSVHLLNADGTEGAEIGKALTLADGSFSVSVPAQHGPIEIKVKGGSYAEEAGGATVELGESELHTFVEKADTDAAVGIDPLTEVATHRAKTLLAGGANGDLESVIPAANQQLAQAVGLTSLTEPSDDPHHPTDPHGNRGKKALFLAAISLHAKTGGHNSIEEATALGEDFKDGKFDGKNDENAQVTVGGDSTPLSATELEDIGNDQKTFAESKDNDGGLASDDATTVNPTPSTLGSFEISAASSSQVVWQAAAGATKYDIKVSLKSDCGSALSEFKTTTTSQSLSTLTLTPATTYYVCVEAEDEAGDELSASNGPFQFVP